jgi:hypothetical protein
MQDIKDELKEESLVGAFPDREAAVATATALDAAGIPPHRFVLGAPAQILAFAAIGALRFRREETAEAI